MFASALLFAGALASSDSPFTLTLLNDTNARCLDGSPFGYYSRLNPASKKWVIYLEGGGLCLSAEACAARAKTSLGTSTVWPDTFTPTTGTVRDILSDDPQVNPFADWNHVYLDYCSGDTWGGTKTKKTADGFYFTGHYNVKAVITHLNETANLNENFDVAMLTGASAGGIGTFHHAGFLRSWLPKKEGKVLAVPMSGYYFPSPIVPYSFWEKGDMQDINVLATIDLTSKFGSALDTKCVKANPDQAHLCWDNSFLYPYIDVPLFVIENRFDKNQINAEWLPPSYQAKNKTRSLGYIEYYGGRMIDSLTEFANKTAKTKGNALFMPSCYDHVIDLCMASGPTIKGRQVAGLLKSWVDQQIAGSKPDMVYIDPCNELENTNGPCSKTCDTCYSQLSFDLSYSK